MMDLAEYEKLYSLLIAKRELAKGTLDQFAIDRAALTSRVESLVTASSILLTVKNATQKKFVEHVSKMVTSIVQAVFDRKFEFVVEYNVKRGQSECEFLVRDGLTGDLYNPKDEMGGGLLDVISFALRVVFWSLENPKSNNVMILDEPMKFVGKGVFMERVSVMMRELSHRLGLQLIVNTHEPELSSQADKVWEVTHDGRQSHVKEL